MADAATNTSNKEPADAAAYFDKDAHGRYPISSNMGAAKTWTAPGQPPRPDIELSRLKWWSALGGILGLDHFYLRSPLTGLAKLLTLGGVGIWWLWDALQVFTEGERVVKYGLSAPFDLMLGIGQGMITDRPTHYEQRSTFSLWQLAAIFGFAGLDSFLIGKWAQGSRKIVEFLFLLSGVIILAIAWNQSGISGLVTFGKIITILMVIFFGSIVMTNWGLSLKSIFMLPDALFETGISVPTKMSEMLNSYTAILDKMVILLGQDTVDKVKSDMNYGSTKGAELKKRFEIDREEHLREEEKNPPTSDEASNNKWLWSFLIWIFMLPMFVVQLGIFIVKGTIYFFFPMKAASDALASASVNEAEHEAKRRIAALQSLPIQGGGARSSSRTALSTEAMVLGAAVIAIVGGGALKAAVDSLVAE
jgi:hypothetical protein